MSDTVAVTAHSPVCPNPECRQPYLSARRPWPDGDALVRCDYCGQSAEPAAWFDHELPNDGVEDMPDNN